MSDNDNEQTATPNVNVNHAKRLAKEYKTEIMTVALVILTLRQYNLRKAIRYIVKANVDHIEATQRMQRMMETFDLEIDDLYNARIVTMDTLHQMDNRLDAMDNAINQLGRL